MRRFVVRISLLLALGLVPGVARAGRYRSPWYGGPPAPSGPVVVYILPGYPQATIAPPAAAYPPPSAFDYDWRWGTAPDGGWRTDFLWRNSEPHVQGYTLR